jgi:hypothetical protein
LLAALQSNMWYQQADEGILRFNPLGTYKSARAYTIQVKDPRLWVSANVAEGTEFSVLLLTAEADLDPACQPMPLPQALVVEFLDHVVTELAAVADLKGHDLLALAAAVEDAKKASNMVPFAWLGRAPAQSYEQTLCDSAARAQARLSSRLARFDKAYATLRDGALSNGHTPVLRILGTQGGVADALDLKPGKSPKKFSMSDDIDLIDLFQHQRRAAAESRAFDLLLSGNKVREFPAVVALTPDRLRWFYRLVRQSTAANSLHLIWRDTEHAIGSAISPTVPVEEIEMALEQFCAAFDRHLMAGIHPVVRSALALIEMIRIQPFPSDNARMVRLFFVAVSDSLGLWALPLPLALHRQRHALQTMLEGTAATGSPDELIDFILTTCEQAVVAGAEMLKVIGAEGSKLRSVLTQCGVSAEQATRTTLTLLTNVFVEVEHDTAYWDAALQEDAAVLHRLGLVDILRLGWRTYWSSPAARQQARFRPARQS